MRLLPIVALVLLAGCVKPLDVMRERDAVVRVQLAEAQKRLTDELQFDVQGVVDDRVGAIKDARMKMEALRAMAHDQLRRAHAVISDWDAVEPVPPDSPRAEQDYCALAGLVESKRLWSGFWARWRENAGEALGAFVGGVLAGAAREIVPGWVRLTLWVLAALVAAALALGLLLWLRGKFWKRASLEGVRALAAAPQDVKERTKGTAAQRAYYWARDRGLLR
jgi:hypothetical protein